MNKISPAFNTMYSKLSIEDIDQMLFMLAEENEGKTLFYLKDDQLLSNQHENMEVIGAKMGAAVRIMKEMFLLIRDTERIPVNDIKNDILPVIEEAAELPHIYFLLSHVQSKDEYTYRHNINVGIISVLIGKWLGLGKKDLADLNLAATLHDIGKTQVSQHILTKPGKLNYSEYKDMKRHTIYGYELLKQKPDLPLSIPLTALQHHEWENGEGYPLKLKGNNLHLFSKITAIADAFHAMSSERIYHHALPFYKVISQMKNDAFGKFDPRILLVFLNKMLETLVGKTVLLTDGQFAKVVMINRYDPLNSLVMTKRGIVNLCDEKELHIEKV
ncbi:HD-GYP domain-containing protein [Peribacillus sp. SCS-155]|uniref:HD-GYP domain-containing protein n=1 Tax=Peribacillus sedimenti TaxID=3115297 RepID=UPI003906312D